MGGEAEEACGGSGLDVGSVWRSGAPGSLGLGEGLCPLPRYCLRVWANSLCISDNHTIISGRCGFISFPLSVEGNSHQPEAQLHPKPRHSLY